MNVENRKLFASDIMSRHVLTIKPCELVENIIEKLNSCTHCGFPVVDDNNRLLGIMIRNHLIVML